MSRPCFSQIFSRNTRPSLATTFAGTLVKHLGQRLVVVLINMEVDGRPLDEPDTQIPRYPDTQIPKIPTLLLYTEVGNCTVSLVTRKIALESDDFAGCINKCRKKPTNDQPPPTRILQAPDSQIRQKVP